MFWAPDVPKYEHNNVSVTVWSGTGYFGIAHNNAPPPNSWAADLENDVCVWHILVQPGGTLELPVAHQGASVNRSLFYVEGGAGHLLVDGRALDCRVAVQVRADVGITLTVKADADAPAEILLLQGRPIAEPVRQHGPFVMNSEAEIDQAFADYQRTKFGGWPWPRDDMVFPRGRKRFAKLNGTEVAAPQEDSCIRTE